MSYRIPWDEMESWDKKRYTKSIGTYYGLDADDKRYTPTDKGSQEKFDPDDIFLKEALRRANQDYDYRRAQEAAMLSAGDVKYQFADKKWSEMTDDEREGLKREEHIANKEAGMIPSTRFANVPSTIESLEDFYNATTFMKDTYENEGLGDNDWKNWFGARDQRAAVKDHYVGLNANNSKPPSDVDEPVSTTPISDKYAQRGAPLSDEAQQAQDSLNEYVSSIRDGSFNDSYRPNAVTSKQSFAKEMLDTQMKNATTGINIDNFSKQREEMKQKNLDNFNKKLYGDEGSPNYSR